MRINKIDLGGKIINLFIHRMEGVGRRELGGVERTGVGRGEGRGELREGEVGVGKIGRRL